jgi:hypothetical protein
MAAESVSASSGRCAVRPDFQHELVVVGAAADAGVVHGVLDAAHGREQRVDRNQADFWSVFLFHSAGQ